MLRKFVGKFITAVLAGGCICSAGAQVADPAASFSMQGFGTAGIARSSSAHAVFVRDLSQVSGLRDGQWSGRTDSILGLQANWQASPEVELVGQVVSRLHYDRGHVPELMWAFAKWEPEPRWSLRAGRIGADFMMLADSRLVGYSYLTVRPPADFFGSLFFSHFDGVDASLTLPFADGLIRGKVFGGYTREKAAGTPGVWDTQGSPVRGWVVDYQKGPWSWRYNYAQIRLASNIDFDPLPGLLLSVGEPVAAAALTTENKLASYHSMGVVYDDGPVQIQGMLNHIHHQSGVFQNSRAGYLLVGYRHGSITPYAGYSWWRSDVRHVPTAMYVPAFEAIMQASTSDQATLTLGARWDFCRDMALKLQWDNVRGSAASRFPYARSDSAWNGKTRVISATLDFVF